MALILLLAVPFFASAQINKSANELAQEVTREYLVTKLFRGKNYQPIRYGELKAKNDKRSSVAWTLEHDFEVSDARPSGFNDIQNKHFYSFLFFLDKRMKIVKAESFMKSR
jgi:hypothetical protein